MIAIENMPVDMLDVARRLAADCLADVAGVTAVVIATVDGFDLASALRGEHDAARIAAMASSISAISGVVAFEAGLGNFKSVTITAEHGFAIVQAVQRPDVELVVQVIADSDAILAQAMHRVATMARALAKVGYAAA
jgi:predicted regulator of Ras-like GTPase activity (Roadblock/LC7/MglB family)